MSEEVLGERDLIRRISEILGGVENDDCAVIDAGERYLPTYHDADWVLDQVGDCAPARQRIEKLMRPVLEC